MTDTKMQEWKWSIDGGDFDSYPSFYAYDFNDAAKKAAAMCAPAPEILHEDYYLYINIYLGIWIKHMESGEMKMFYISLDIDGNYSVREW